VLADLRFAFRMLAKAPGFTAIAVLTLALGIGSATTAFTALDALLLRPLPLIQHQDRMLWINEALPAKGVESTDISALDFLDWRARTKTLSAVWLYDHRTVIIGGGNEPVRKLGSGLSAGAFAAMGVQPILGRDFRPEEDLAGAPPVALLSYGLWQTQFGGEPDILGRTIQLNGLPTEVIGVMPQGWRYPERSDLWLPLRINPTEHHRGEFGYPGHAMLKPGVSLDEARAEFATISAALAREYPATNGGIVATLRPVREEAVQDTAQLTVLLFGAVMFVFLIACANVANLLLARASVRSKEIAIRLALGATRTRIVTQLLVESLLLSALGGIGGFLFALWGVDLMLAAIPIELPFWLRFDVDPRVFLFIAGLSTIASLLFGLAPAWQASRPEVVEELKEGGRSSGGPPRTHQLRHALVVIEIALALVLLVGAGLMMRSFLRLNQVDPGFDPRDVLTFRVGFPPAMITDPQTKQENKDVIRRFIRDLIPRLAALPGVEAASATSHLPGLGLGGFSQIIVEGRPVPKNPVQADSALARVATPEFFTTLRIAKKSGRFFTDADDAGHPAVAIVDEAFARRFFPGTDPIGRRFRTIMEKPGEAQKWFEIVGVVGTARRALDRDEPTPSFYLPHAQEPSNFMSIAMRVHGEPAAFVMAARAEVLAVNKDLPIYDEQSLEHAVLASDNVWIKRFFGYLFSAFAVVALLLASVGIYGVMAYAVTQRTQEIGVRVALGAEPRDVIRMIVWRGIGLVGVGLAVGFVAAYFTAELLAGSLYGVSPHDPPTFAVVPVLLATVALLACYVPSRRATRIDPILALRAE
jgi:putative ABC transport system permease protein